MGKVTACGQKKKGMNMAAGRRFLDALKRNALKRKGKGNKVGDNDQVRAEEPQKRATDREETQIAVPGELAVTHLVLPQGMTFERWEEAGRVLSAVRNCSQWAIGDWLLYGQHNYGEKFAQAAEITGMNRDSLAVYQWVSGRIPPPARRADVSFAHHQVLAKLEPKEVSTWLQKTADKSLSVADLRVAVREKKAKQLRGKGEELDFRYKVNLEFEDDPGEEFLDKLEKYIAREGGKVKKRSW